MLFHESEPVNRQPCHPEYNMTSKRSTLTAFLDRVAASKRSSTAQSGAAYFTNSEFTDHNGRPVRFYDDIIKDKLVIINMMYTVCTGICPSNTANLLTVQQALGNRIGRDIHMVSLTLRPELDSPAALRAYIKQYGIAPGWTFLTGKRASMETVRRKLGFYDSNPNDDAQLSRHTGMLSMGNDKLDRWCMMPALTATHQIVKIVEDMT
jgi:protein SCO1/2